ncbi:MAG: anti-sigma factor family protein [Candidatus Kapaibacterium sp.]
MMKAYEIEDTIIAYFDGRLNDAESAELLHRVSISPEIREIFEEHDALRQIAVRAARQSTISSEMEESLFRRIESLQDEEKLPIGFWTVRRVSVTASAIALILLGVVNSFQFQKSVGNVATGSSIKSIASSAQYSITRIENSGSRERALHSATFAPIHRVAKKSAASIPFPNAPELAEDIPPAITLHPIPQTAEIASIQLPTTFPGTLQSLRNLPEVDAISKFDVGLSSPMSGFSFPSSVPQQGLFSDVTVHAAYNFDEKNQVGIKMIAGSFAGLTTASTKQMGFTLVDGQMKLQSGYAGELFYRHREPINGGMFFVTGGAGGGFYSLGTLLSAELGIEVPFGEHLLGGVSLVVSRLHQNGSESTILSSSAPVIFDGPNVFNTLNGSIEYALNYRF